MYYIVYVCLYMFCSPTPAAKGDKQADTRPNTVIHMLSTRATSRRL